LSGVAGTDVADAPGERRISEAPPEPRPRTDLPRLGFLGLGWIGRARMEAVVEAGAAHVGAFADPSPEARQTCRSLAPDASEGTALDDLLDLDLDGLVIATPSALHARDAERALRAGIPVFCQKPLGRTGAECRRVVEAARTANRLLAVDLCYRRTRAAAAVKDLVRTGALGRVYAMDLVFHNAYGPDKPWFYRRTESGGGCLLDLGTHLVDLALWLLDETSVESARGKLLHGGAPLPGEGEDVEDFATAELSLVSGTHARLACSWRLSAGIDAVISVHVWGTDGGAAMRNVNGSYYDFVAERYRGTTRETLVEPPDAWGGRAFVAWARDLARSSSYDPAIESMLEVSRVLDRLYDR